MVSKGFPDVMTSGRQYNIGIVLTPCDYRKNIIVYFTIESDSPILEPDPRPKITCAFASILVYLHCVHGD